MSRRNIYQEDNLRVRRVSLANTVQDPHVLPVLLEHIKQRRLEQLLAPLVPRVSQDLPIRLGRVPLLQTGCVQRVLHVRQEHGEVLPAQQR